MGRDLYVALGDSITLGHGASHQRLACSNQLVEWARHYHFQVVAAHKAFLSNEPYWIEGLQIRNTR